MIAGLNAMFKNMYEFIAVARCHKADPNEVAEEVVPVPRLPSRDAEFRRRVEKFRDARRERKEAMIRTADDQEYEAKKDTEKLLARRQGRDPRPAEAIAQRMVYKQMLQEAGMQESEPEEEEVPEPEPAVEEVEPVRRPKNLAPGVRRSIIQELNAGVEASARFAEESIIKDEHEADPWTQYEDDEIIYFIIQNIRPYVIERPLYPRAQRILELQKMMRKIKDPNHPYAKATLEERLNICGNIGDADYFGLLLPEEFKEAMNE